MDTRAHPRHRWLSRAGATGQRGSAMIEFAIVGPIITLLGLAILQYAMLFFAKNQINHAGFIAARAGSTGHADLTTVQTAYVRALLPLYGGGRDSPELAAAYGRAAADVAGHARIELLNPTRESFDDWNDAALQSAIGSGRRVIPNAGLAFRNPTEIKGSSGQSIHDANLIKLRITHGYEPKVPLIGPIYTRYLNWLDNRTDAFHTRLIDAGRIPVESHVTLQMQSDAIEPADPVSLPGLGNAGHPSDPGDPVVVATAPPACLTVGCTVPRSPVDPGGGGGPGPCLPAALR